MAKFLVSVSIRLTNTYEIETDEYKGEPDRIAESQLRDDLDSDIEFPKRINIVENMVVKNVGPTGQRWEIDEVDVDDVSLMDK